MSTFNRWAVLVSSSDYWFNYRHMNSVLALHDLLLRRGFLSSNILLLNALDAACSPLNPSPGCVFANTSLDSDVFHSDTIIDFKGRDVSVRTFLDLLSGRNDYPSWKRLASDENSLVLVYMSGHGGDEFFKFNDHEELTSHELARVLQEMHIRRRYGHLLLVLDTCQAETLGREISSPNVTFIASSRRGENSYGYHWSEHLSAGLTDRFSFALLQFLQQTRPSHTIRDMMNAMDPRFLHANVFVSSTYSATDAYDIDLLDFFSDRIPIQLIEHSPRYLPHSLLEEPQDAGRPNSTTRISHPQRISLPTCPYSGGQSRGPITGSLDLIRTLLPICLVVLYILSKQRQP